MQARWEAERELQHGEQIGHVRGVCGGADRGPPRARKAALQGAPERAQAAPPQHAGGGQREEANGRPALLGSGGTVEGGGGVQADPQQGLTGQAPRLGPAAGEAVQVVVEAGLVALEEALQAVAAGLRGRAADRYPELRRRGASGPHRTGDPAIGSSSVRTTSMAPLPQSPASLRPAGRSREGAQARRVTRSVRAVSRAAQGFFRVAGSDAAQVRPRPQPGAERKKRKRMLLTNGVVALQGGAPPGERAQ